MKTTKTISINLGYLYQLSSSHLCILSSGVILSDHFPKEYFLLRSWKLFFIPGALFLLLTNGYAT